MIKTAPRYVAIVRRGQTHVFTRLTSRAAELGVVEVVWDRRVGSRRRSQQAVGEERRRRDRRSRPRPTWDSLGFVLAPSRES